MNCEVTRNVTIWLMTEILLFVQKGGDIDNLVARIIKRGDMDNLVAR